MKRFLCLATVLIMLFNCLAVSAEQYQGNPDFYDALKNITYQDIAYLPVDNWSNNAIFTMSAMGIMKGSYNIFNPYGLITATEALAVIFRCAGLEEQCGKMYNSVEAQRKANPSLYNNIDKWADGYMRMAVDKKLITIDQFMSAMDINYPNNSKLFEKDKPVTRATLSVWLVKTLELEVAKTEIHIKDFDDYSQIKEEDKLYLETAVKNGIISGDGANIMPYGNVTREQIAQIMYNSMNLWLEKCGFSVISGHIDEVYKDSVNKTDKIINTTNYKIGEEELVTLREYRLNGEAVDYTEDKTLKYVDFPVLQKNCLPAESSVLEKSKNVSAYVKNGKVMLVSIKDDDEKLVSANYDEYSNSNVYVGKLYITDTQEQIFVIKNENDELVEIPYFSGVEVYSKNKIVELDKLNEEHLDKTVYIFTLKKNDISLDRCYKIQILD